MYEIVKHYRDQEHLRHSFNKLAEKTFGLNFEGWYRNGYWSENYDPYSVLVDGEIVANVSVNTTDLRVDGEIRHLIQLGTVMTEERYRNRGMIRAIMAEIQADWADKSDGMYLFANDSVLDFYPKFGFRKGKEYEYTKDVFLTGNGSMIPVPMETPAQWKLLEAAIGENQFRGACDLVGNIQLIMFYVTQYMQNCVYRDEESGAYVIAEREGDTLRLFNVFASQPMSLDQVISRFGSEIRHVVLGFAPVDSTGYRITALREDDCTFFIKGAVFDSFEREELRIPALAHA